MSQTEFESISVNNDKLSLSETIRIFFKIGITGFGGPLAIIEQMRTIFVQERQHLSNQEFNQIFTILKAMPGPIAFQYSVYLGKRFAGFPGAFIAALGVVLPASTLMLFLAIFYARIIEFQEMQNFMLGMQYAVAGVISFTIFNLAKPTAKNWKFLLLAMMSAVAFGFGWVPEVIIILLAGLIVVGLKRIKPTQLSMFSTTALPVIAMTETEKLLQISKVFFLAGTFIFGTGLAAFPYFKSALVDQMGLLDLKTFNDGLSFGQISPGPVTISSVFYGYRIAEWSGAFLAIFMMYLMPFIHMSTWFPKAVHALAKKNWIQDFTFGGTAAIVGCLAVTLLDMNQYELTKVSFWFTAIVVLGVLVSFKKVSIFKVIIAFALINYLWMMVAAS